METSYTRPKVQKSMRLRVRGWIRIGFTLAVLVAAPLVMVNLFKQEAHVRFNGIVESGSLNVSPVEASRVVEIKVEEGQRVNAGDILVCFDSAQQLFDESMNDIKIRELEQRLVNRRDDLIETERRCRDIVRDAEVRLEETLMDEIRDTATLAGYEAELKLIDPLIQKKLISETDIIKVRPKAVALREIVKKYKTLNATLRQTLAGAQDDLKEASARREKGEEEVDKALESIRAAYERSDAVRKANPSVLRAVAAGTVSKIFHRPGDIVVEGEPVLRLKTGDGVTYVTGMLPSGMQDAVKVGDTVYVTRQLYAMGQTAPSVAAVVEAIDAEVMDLFDNSGRAENTTVRGRKVRIRLTGDAAGFVPGESITVSDAPLDSLGISGLFK